MRIYSGVNIEFVYREYTELLSGIVETQREMVNEDMGGSLTDFSIYYWFSRCLLPPP